MTFNVLTTEEYENLKVWGYPQVGAMVVDRAKNTAYHDPNVLAFPNAEEILSWLLKTKWMGSFSLNIKIRYDHSDGTYVIEDDSKGRYGRGVNLIKALYNYCENSFSTLEI